MSQMRRIDLNSDLGEGFGPWSMGDDAAMMDVATSANVACGGHAGDPETMFVTLSFAAQRGVVVGAHPGYADREGFGRRVIPMSEGEIEHMVAAQVGALMGIGAVAGAPVRYVKPHGALGNLAADFRHAGGMAEIEGFQVIHAPFRQVGMRIDQTGSGCAAVQVNDLGGFAGHRFDLRARPDRHQASSANGNRLDHGATGILRNNVSPSEDHVGRGGRGNRG